MGGFGGGGVIVMGFVEGRQEMPPLPIGLEINR
jgi:hypothetical protein